MGLTSDDMVDYGVVEGETAPVTPEEVKVSQETTKLEGEGGGN